MRFLPLSCLGFVVLLGCSEDQSDSTVTIRPDGQASSGGAAGSAGQAAGAGGEDTAGQGGTPSGGQAGQTGQAGMSGASGQAGKATAGAAGAGGGAAGAGAAGQAGSGAGGQGGGATAAVAFVQPAEGATVQNPVAFQLTAQGVDEVELVADDMFSVPLTWNPVSSAQHSFTYSFTNAGARTLVLSGYLTGQSAPVATATRHITVENPAASVCDAVMGAPFVPPTTCDKLSGNTTSEIPSNGLFSTSWFGCYLKSDGTIYKDPSDNCEFACGNKGLCDSGLSGPECEAKLKWFAADADRYGCGSRIRVTNCANGKQVVLATLDRGPNCKSVEQKYGAPVLDMSHDAMVYLFDGKTYGGSDKKAVVVEKVAADAKLGPAE